MIVTNHKFNKIKYNGFYVEFIDLKNTSYTIYKYNILCVEDKLYGYSFNDEIPTDHNYYVIFKYLNREIPISKETYDDLSFVISTCEPE